MNFNVCRACMTPDSDNKLTSIFTENGKLSNFVFELTNLKIPNIKESPALLCPSCINDLTKAISFRNLFIKNHKNFTDFYSQSKLRSLLCGIKVDDNFDCGPSKIHPAPEQHKNSEILEHCLTKGTENLPAFNIQGYIKDLLTEKFTVNSETEQNFTQNKESSLKVAKIQESFIKQEPMEDEVEELDVPAADKVTIKTEDGDKFDIFEASDPTFNDDMQDDDYNYGEYSGTATNNSEFPLLLSALSSRKSPTQPTSSLCQNCGHMSDNGCQNCSMTDSALLDVHRGSQREKIIQKYLEDPTVTITALSRWADVPRTTVGRIIENFKNNKSPIIKRPGAGRKAGTGNVEREEKIIEMLKIHPQLTVRQLAQMFGTCPANVQKIKVRHGLAFKRRSGGSERSEEDDN
ncbi:uncharacterized protein [Chironomus tepperi]|uniref:uncharacterized protein n=1 Tax=Chironomus tepperi TaxID=113505 RepID=UPI00391F98D7